MRHCWASSYLPSFDACADGVFGASLPSFSRSCWLPQAADWVKSHPGNIVRVNGFASTVGSRQANVLLADLRAQVVVDQLQSDGVDPKRIQQRGHGPVQFALTAQESRRVEISIGRR